MRASIAQRRGYVKKAIQRCFLGIEAVVWDNLGYWRTRIDCNGDLVIEVRDSGTWVQQANWTA
jgi:hypothetical protein